MSYRLVKRYVFLALTLITMAFIFYMSSQNATVSTNTSGSFIGNIANFISKHFRNSSESEKRLLIMGMQRFVRKAAHLTVYLILGFFCFGFFSQFELSFLKRALFAFSVSVLYAISDEVHQTFVKGRSGEIKDVIIDTLGIVLGILLYTVIIYVFKKIRGMFNGAKEKDCIKA